MKILAIGNDGTDKRLVVENDGMYYVIYNQEGDRIETPESAYKFGGFVDYHDEVTQQRFDEVQKIVDKIGDDLPDWYRNAKED